MKYKSHKVQPAENLEDISKKYDISIEDIKKANPDVKIFKPMYGAEYVVASQELKIPVFTKEEKTKEIALNSESFYPKARYRCSQNNLILIDGEPHFSCEIKTQYLYSILKERNTTLRKINLEDYITSIQPQNMQDAFELIKEIELLRNDVVFSDEENKISKVYNFDSLSRKWKDFTKNKMNHIAFFKELKERNPKSIQDFISNGNKEFSNEKAFKEVIQKNLFYYVLLHSLNAEIKEFKLIQNSQIFPNISLETNFIKTVVKEEELTTTYRLVGTLNKESLDDSILQNLYIQMYQPLIKFSYTEFDFVFRITYTVENKTGILKNANVSIKEYIKNNYEIITKFDLKEVNL